VALTAALVALLQALCLTVLEAEPPPPANRGDYAQNRWAALRFGPRAELIHPDGRSSGARSGADARLLALIQPAVQQLGTVELIGAFDPDSCEGDRQLAVGRDQGLDAVAADAVERTVRSP
jgi:gamma-glutamyl:cysteine ligase YbdK (ATP-grasp superfamily)